MTTLESPRALDELIRRFASLSPASQRAWGRMNAGQMLCHLSDSLLVLLGERTAASRVTFVSRNLLRPMALRLPAQWPHGIPTGEQVDQERGGTPPQQFDADRERVIALTRRFLAAPAESCAPHPAFGRLSRWELMRWAYLHADHHLRQFGV